MKRDWSRELKQAQREMERNAARIEAGESEAMLQVVLVVHGAHEQNQPHDDQGDEWDHGDADEYLPCDL